MNRSDFVVRMLTYYADSGYEHRISIGDSSDDEHLARTREAIERLRGRLDVRHVAYPGVKTGACLRLLIDAVDTPYAAILPDDDYLVPSALDQCIVFLEQHAGHSAAHGKGIVLYSEASGPYVPVRAGAAYIQATVLANTAGERLSELLNNYNTSLFSVMRVATWARIFPDIGLTDTTFAAELFPCCLSVVYGRVAELDVLYLARHVHDRRYILPDVTDWTAGPQWKAAFDAVRQYLIREIATIDGVSSDRAAAIVDSSFAAYLGRGGHLQAGQSCPGMWGIVRCILRRVPLMFEGAKRIRHAFAALRYRTARTKELSLQALLHRNSVYNAEFMPIYRSMTGARGDRA